MLRERENNTKNKTHHVGWSSCKLQNSRVHRGDFRGELRGRNSPQQLTTCILCRHTASNTTRRTDTPQWHKGIPKLLTHATRAQTPPPPLAQEFVLKRWVENPEIHQNRCRHDTSILVRTNVQQRNKAQQKPNGRPVLTALTTTTMVATAMSSVVMMPTPDPDGPDLICPDALWFRSEYLHV